MLDFGCYTGGLLSQLGSNYQRNGIEVNRAAADIASQNVGGDVWSSIEEIPDGVRFDIVIAADVIEHVTNPSLLVEQLISKLPEGAILILTTGDADNPLWNRFGANWWYCYYPEHIVYFKQLAQIRFWLCRRDYCAVRCFSPFQFQSIRPHGELDANVYLRRVSH